MPDNARPVWEPPCDKCSKPMRLVGIEGHPDSELSDLHTFQCECGELGVFSVTQYRGAATNGGER